MRRIIFLLLILALQASSAKIHSQELDNVLSYMKTAMRFSMLRPQEKVYLHFDNTGYFKGETMWFKAYVVRTDGGTPTDLSRILYVELLNPSGDVVESRKLPIKDGVAYGDIKVDSIMTTGFFEVRAYTRYMTNWGTNACFSRVFPIFDAPKFEGRYDNPTLDKISYRHRLNNEREASVDVKNNNVVSVGEGDVSEKVKVDDHVHFYPEGGSLVAGKPVRVAFSLTDKEGLPMRKAKCSCVDKNGATLSTSTTDVNGYGVFTLKQAVDGLSLLIDGAGKKYDFPKCDAEGCAMDVDMLDDDTLTVNVYASQGVQGHLLGYVMVNNGKVVRCDTLTATDCVVRKFDRHNLPEGVSQITVFNAEGHILAERMFFVCPQLDGTERVVVKSETETLRPCGKVTFSLSAQPESNLSFSAVDGAGVVNGATGNMLTWMLLGSELKGHIAHPEYYFEADDEAHRRAADLLMMVQGWRRYDWNLMSGQSTFAKFEPIEDKQYLFGRLQEKSRKYPVNDVWLDTKLFNRQGQVVEGTTKTDSLGNYVFILPEVEGEWNLSINTGVADKKGMWKDVNYFVAIDRNFSPAGRYISPLEASAIPVDEKRFLKWKFSEKDEQWVSMTHKDHVLKNVTVTAKGRVWDRTNWANEHSARKTSNVYYDVDKYADRLADEGEHLPSFGEWLLSVNSFFGGSDMPMNIAVATPVDTAEGTSTDSSTGLKNIAPVDDATSAYYTDVPRGCIRFYTDGLTYKNRPIVWVIDNMFVTITNFPERKFNEVMFNENDNLSNTVIELPMDLEEINSVYVSEELEPLHKHLFCSEIDNLNPVVLYVYTHRSMTWDKKGMRNTHYQGYNVPSTFQMENYSDIPPMEDYRRTLYWQPEVKTDANGNAKIEFWNNSTCKEMRVSCEGMTPQGKVMTNE